MGAVYTTNQTACRGGLGRSWVNAEGKALYYTVAIREPLAQPATLPLLASLPCAASSSCATAWTARSSGPTTFLLNGKKIVGILCESVSYGYEQQGRGILCGIGINLAQPQSYFDAADLPHGTSLALQGAAVDLAADPQWLAEGLTDFGFDRPMYVFAREGFAPFRGEYKAACVNIGRRVTFDLPGGGQGAGEAIDVDEEGRLVVRTDSGEEHVFTGEVSVHGIYGRCKRHHPLRHRCGCHLSRRARFIRNLYQEKKNPLRRLRYTGGGSCFLGVLLWCEEESCARETVAAPLPLCSIVYPISEQKSLHSCKFL